MAIIKCRVYENNEQWGGGMWIVPKEFIAEFEKEKRKDCAPEGEFQFDENFLNQCIGQTFFNQDDESKGFYYDNTWCI